MHSLNLAFLQSIHVHVDAICTRMVSRRPAWGGELLELAFIEDSSVAELHDCYYLSIVQVVQLIESAGSWS